jgi:hypothetical protein
MHLRSQKTTNLVGNVRHALKDLMRLRIWAESMDSVRFSGFEGRTRCFQTSKKLEIRQLMVDFRDGEVRQLVLGGSE